MPPWVAHRKAARAPLTFGGRSGRSGRDAARARLVGRTPRLAELPARVHTLHHALRVPQRGASHQGHNRLCGEGNESGTKSSFFSSLPSIPQPGVNAPLGLPERNLSQMG